MTCAGSVFTTPMSVTLPTGRPEWRSAAAILSRTEARFEARAAGVAFTGRGRVVPGGGNGKRKSGRGARGAGPGGLGGNQDPGRPGAYGLGSGVAGAGRGLVLDSGMHPKFVGEEALPNMNAMTGRKSEAIIVSHSHQDHIGTLPVLMRRQPQARVFMTEPTADIGDVLLHNSVNVMTRQREDLGTTLYPLFTHRETDRAADRWHTCALRQP